MKCTAVFLASLLAGVGNVAGSLTGGQQKEKRQLLNALLNTTFDYVIVGAGTAGLAIADRLSADGTHTVAVIEAGSLYEVTNPELSTVPAGDSFFCGSSPADTNPLVDWDFNTVPQAGANNRVVHYARGKCLGGSSARKFMIYQRPTRGSLQQWANAVGDQSHTFDNFLPYYKPFSATGGPLEVSYANYGGPFSSYIQGSLNEIAIPTAQDFNSGTLSGCQYCSSTISPVDESRESSQSSFLNEAASRPNLHVFVNTKAKRILFDSSRRAIGVAVTTLDLLPYTITATKEVIVSAGSFQSPQLLIVSGIGPAATLSQFNIPPISRLAGVGQNMWDHIFFAPSYRVKLDTFTRLANDPIYLASQFALQYTPPPHTGVLTNPIADFLAWEKVPAFLRTKFTPKTNLDLAQFAPDWPEIEFLAAPGYVGDFASLPFTQPRDGYQYASILMALVAPLSRGNISITSTDTDDLPLINPAWLTSPTAQQVAIAAYKRVRQAFNSKFMAQVLADPVEYFPGPQVQTDEQILEVIRNTLMTVWHAACTCKMGKKEDPMAVVDNNARVFRVSGLRVVDASAFPILPPGHPQSTIYALVEKISEKILQGS